MEAELWRLDTTNVLAVEAALRRRKQPPTSEVHLAACAPVLRAQPFGPGSWQHFRLFTLVSSGRDSGSRRTEATLLMQHIRFWQTTLGQLAHGLAPRVEVSVFDDSMLGERLIGVASPATECTVPVLDVPDRERGRGYYTAAGVRLVVDDTEVGDGGLTSWTAALNHNAKERCMVSVLATERLTELTKGRR